MNDLMTSSTTSPEEKNGAFYKWFNHEIDINDKGQLCEGEMTEDGIKEQHAKWRPEEGEVETIIIDSGSDVSLLPRRFYNVDKNIKGEHKLQDCQGRKLYVDETRETDIEVLDSQGAPVTLRHRFLVGDVTSCLLSLGQLLKSGWTLQHDRHHADQIRLCSPDALTEIPAGYRGTSLAIQGTVRRVEDEEGEEDNDELEVALHVRMLVKIKTVTNKYIDIKTIWGERFPYRSTFIRELRTGEPENIGQWQMVEFCENIMSKPNMTKDITECGGVEWLVMTIASNDLFDFDKLFEMMDEDIVSPIIGAAEAEARSQGAHGLRPEQLNEAEASQEHAENEPMEMAKEVVNKRLFGHGRSQSSSQVAWSFRQWFKTEDP